MSKELEAFNGICCNTNQSYPDFQKQSKIVETALKKQEQDQKKLKAFEIIKDKGVDVDAIKYAVEFAINYYTTQKNAKTKEFIKPYIYYNISKPRSKRLTEEEFDSVVEVLL